MLSLALHGEPMGIYIPKNEVNLYGVDGKSENKLCNLYYK